MQQNGKIALITVAIVFLMVFGITNGSLIFDGDEGGRSYTINDAIINITVQDNSTIHVEESYLYKFKGSYNGVKRNIPLKSGEKIDNLEVYTKNAYARYYTDVRSDEYNITTYLYADEAENTKIHDTEVTITYSYDFSGVVKYSDADMALFQFKLIGGEWDKSINGVTAYVTYPSSQNVQYFINPYEYNDTQANWDDSTLKIEVNDEVSGYLEINSILPKSQFSSLDDATYENKDFGTYVPEKQRAYANEYIFAGKYLPVISAILILLSIFVPLGIYLIYGREPKIEYDALYEREPPSDDSPAFISAMGTHSKFTDIGKLSDNAFKASIMDLIDRKYLTLIHSDSETMKLRLTDKDLSSLKDFEIEAINIIRKYEINGIIDFDHMKNQLSYETQARDYVSNLKTWKENFESRYLSDEVISKYFDNRGYNYLIYFTLIMVVVCILSIIFALFNFNNENAALLLIATSIFIIIALLLLTFVVSNTLFGRWTTYGKEYNDKWYNFQKYLKDFSLMEEYPPESVKVWNKYLVYATGLGVAATVSKAMAKLLYSETSGYDNDTYAFYYYGGYDSFSNAMDTGYSTVSAADSSSSGGVGGGSGGGGGGAF